MESIKVSIALICCFILVGCVSIPKDIRGGTNVVSSVNYEELVLSPDSYIGKEVRIGGKVLKVTNTPRNTIFEIAVLPLDQGAKPEIHKRYQGRILALSEGFVDPDNIRGHFITVLGKLKGQEKELIGKAPYSYLKIDIMGMQIWKVVDDYIPLYGWQYNGISYCFDCPDEYFYNPVFAPVSESSYLVR